MQEYNRNIEKYNTNLLSSAQDVQLIKNDLNEASHNLVSSVTQKDGLVRQKSLLDEEIGLKQGLLEQLRKDYE